MSQAKAYATQEVWLVDRERIPETGPVRLHEQYDDDGYSPRQDGVWILRDDARLAAAKLNAAADVLAKSQSSATALALSHQLRDIVGLLESVEPLIPRG